MTDKDAQTRADAEVIMQATGKMLDEIESLQSRKPLNADALDMLHFAVRRVRFLAWRELVVADMNQSSISASRASEMNALAGEVNALAVIYAKLWDSENRPWWREQMLDRYTKLEAELRELGNGKTLIPSP
jgi:hypothetical protein